MVLGMGLRGDSRINARMEDEENRIIFNKEIIFDWIWYISICDYFYDCFAIILFWSSSSSFYLTFSASGNYWNTFNINFFLFNYKKEPS
jgi:hypothetical protein